MFNKRPMDHNTMFKKATHTKDFGMKYKNTIKPPVRNDDELMKKKMEQLER